MRALAAPLAPRPAPPLCSDFGESSVPGIGTNPVQTDARLDAARNQDRGSGAGLGLAIAADIARGHGGELRLGDSDRFGGLCAEIVLPI